MKTVVFIGHNECYSLSEEKLNDEIIKCIQKGAKAFLSGGQGRFDRICAYMVRDLKSTYPHIKNNLVIPYLNFKVFVKDIFDEIIYPNNFEKLSFKAAIPQRNKYMVNHADTAICYIQHGWGNAINTFYYAQKKKLEIINLSTYNG